LYTVSTSNYFFSDIKLYKHLSWQQAQMRTHLQKDAMEDEKQHCPSTYPPETKRETKMPLAPPYLLDAYTVWD